MTLLETDIFAILIALVFAAGALLFCMRALYNLEQENRQLRAALQRYTRGRSTQSD